MQDAKSENLDDIFEKSITEYRSLKKGSMAYYNSYSKRMALKVKINNALINSYNLNCKMKLELRNWDKGACPFIPIRAAAGPYSQFRIKKSP